MCKQINQTMTSQTQILTELAQQLTKDKKCYLPYKVNILHWFSASIPRCVLTCDRLTYSCLYRGSGLAVWSKWAEYFFLWQVTFETESRCNLPILKTSVIQTVSILPHYTD